MGRIVEIEADCEVGQAEGTQGVEAGVGLSSAGGFLLLSALSSEHTGSLSVVVDTSLEQ
jgi:hypothetical protein